MPHNPQLIEVIAAKLAFDYPRGQYTYIIEQFIKGTRMSPDILVVDKDRPEELLCAVEIGYTRPEKLTAYRKKLRIPDVRWYDKSGTLHGDVKESVRRPAIITVEPTRVFLYSLQQRVWCSHCQEYDEEIDEFYGGLVYSILVTDYIRWLCPSYCDDCGTNWFADDIDAGGVIDVFSYMTTQEIGMDLGARRTSTWDRAKDEVDREYGLALFYEDGEFVRPEYRDIVGKQIRIIRNDRLWSGDD